MGFYYRKSINFGGIRFNFSKSGIGVSVGVKGFRMGKGPRGNYIHIGRNGLYYRRVFGKKKKTPKPSQQQEPRTEIKDQETYIEIESEHTAGIIDSSSAELLKEINEKQKKLLLWPICLFLILIPDIGTVTAILASLAIYFLLDKKRKTTVLLYDINKDVETEIQSFYDSFTPLIQSHSVWNISAQAHTNNYKYNAGADTLVKRKRVKISMKAPRYIKTNVVVPKVPLGTTTLYFFPDRVLIYEKKTVGGVSYEYLKMQQFLQRFIESGVVPTDGEIVDYTWQYVNKAGGPDRRFKNNRRLPIMLYTELDLKSDSGLNKRPQFSKPKATAPLLSQLSLYQQNKFILR